MNQGVIHLPQPQGQGPNPPVQGSQDAYKLEDCSISMGPFIDTLQQLHESQTSLLLTKY
jgi:hypothetical protein